MHFSYLLYCAQVETLLENLDAKFDEMSTQILDRSMFFYSEQYITYISIYSVANVDKGGCS